MGRQTALDWCISSCVFTAAEALERGFVRSLHAGADLLPAARALALEMTVHSAPVSVALTRQMLWQMSAAPHPMMAPRLDSRAIQSRGQSGDAQEGIAGFLEKRFAQWPQQASRDMPGYHPWADEPKFEQLGGVRQTRSPGLKPARPGADMQRWTPHLIRR